MSESEDFQRAVKIGMTCSDCRHFQRNKKVKERIIDDSCYHRDAMQSTYYGEQSMQVSTDFLCNRFQEHKE